MGERGYMVSLRINLTHFGGGCLISDLHVLTAAQCICRIKKDGGPDFKDATVLIGTNDLSTVGNDHGIERVEPYYAFDCHLPLVTGDYDIGVIMVRSLILLNHSIILLSQ